VNETNELAFSLLAKIGEQVDRAVHLLELVPPTSIDRRPLQGLMSMGELLGHLLECLSGFCAVLHAAYPERLAHFAELREMQVNHACGIEEARERAREYMNRIEEGFALVQDPDLARRLPTLFVPDGETVLTLFLGNLEHLINHKYQLFIYLKILSIEVGTPDLYVIRDFKF
jgi:uncharacterized damage-inducible protein DinB